MLWKIKAALTARLLSLAMVAVPSCKLYRDPWRQSMKMAEEAVEVRQAIVNKEGPDRVNEEAVDVVCAVANYLRRVPRDQRVRAFRYVLDKNRERGYW